ncbi:Asp23/Gls24 family envelope stress response protein [bacterium 1xD8-6]|nr:Asp23/Gls24 family envelope stress response protein [bacterium D16-36]RKI70832.1 Asp23/Gls24 family envelope stress response protein [bacterium 1xD8-6]
MKGKMNTEMGDIVIARDVLAKYAGTATTDCIGIVGMAAVNMKDGVTKLLKKENAARGVNVAVNDNRVKIELHVIVAYGVSIRAVAQNVLESVRYKVEEYTGLTVEKINVVVEGVRIVDED